MTEEEVYKMARNAAAYGLYTCHYLKYLPIVTQYTSYFENCLAYLNKTIKERWPESEADLQTGQNK